MTGQSPKLPSIADWTAPYGRRVLGACVAYGHVWVAGGFLAGFDLHSGAPSALNDRRIGAIGGVAPYGGGLITATQSESPDGQVYTLRRVDVETGEATDVANLEGEPDWMVPYRGSALVVAYLKDQSRGLYRVPAPTEASSSLLGPSWTSLTSTPAVAGDEVYVPGGTAGVGFGVDVVDATSLSGRWHAPTDDEASILVPAYADGRYLAYVDGNRQLYVWDTHHRVRRFKGKLSAQPARLPPLVRHLRSYVATPGALQMIDLRNRTTATVTVGHDLISGPVVSDDGALFYSSRERIYIVDPSKPQLAVEYPDPELAPLRWPWPVAFENQALLYADDQNVASARLDVLDEFYAESSLIRDFDFSAGPESPASRPNFEVEVTLTKKDGTPRANQAVRLAAKSGTTLTYEGRAHAVVPNQFVTVVTDSAGRFRVALAAGSADSEGTFHAGISAPELRLTSPSMDSKLAVIVNPDGELHQQLASVTADQLKNAKGYDGSWVVNDEYRNDDARMKHATAAINQTAGMVRTSRTETRTRSEGNKYCSPAADHAVVHCRPIDAPAPALKCTQSFSMDLSAADPHFKLLTADEARAALGIVAARSIISELWDDIKRGVAKIEKVVVNALETGAEVLIKTAEKVYKDIINLVEHAVLIVQGIFNLIAEAIHRVIEAVSFLFDWDAIVALHNQIKTDVEAAGRQLTGYSAELKSALTSQLSTAKTKADSALQAIRSSIAGTTLTDAQKAHGGGRHAAAGGAKSNWMLGKFRDHAVPGSRGHGVQRSPAASGAVWPPEYVPGPGVRGAFEAFLDKVKTEVTADVSQAIDRAWADISGPGNTTALGRALEVVVDAVSLVVDVAFDVMTAVVELLVDLLNAMVSEMLAFAKRPIEIPFLSHFYKWLTGNELTLLDLFALLVAIPTGFISKLVSSEPAYASRVSAARPDASRAATRDVSGPGRWRIAAGAAKMLWGVLWGVLAWGDLEAAYAERELPAGSVRMATQVRLACTVAMWVVVRLLLLGALLEAGPSKEAWFVWALPAGVMAADCAYMGYQIYKKAGKANPDLEVLMAVFAAVAGSIVFAAPILARAPLLPSLYAVAVGVALMARPALLMKAPKVQLGGIVVSAAALVASGVIEIFEADGTHRRAPRTAEPRQWLEPVLGVMMRSAPA